MKVLAVVGTRPEAIKMAPVIREMRNRSWMSTCVVATAQHRHMLDQIFDEFGLVADHDLDLMTHRQTLSDLTARCLGSLDKVLLAERPDLVIAQGDTTTTFVSALVSFYRRIPFAHVEAGLRTYDYDNPFPEEFNRQVATKLADVHFAPTETARDNLLREGVPADRVSVTGNTVIDALLATAGTLRDRDADAPVRKMLVTVHRRENFGPPLHRICAALHRLLTLEPGLEITWPVHPNPNIRDYVHTCFSEHPRVRLVPPLGYSDFVRAMVDADIIVSDSGGVQEEAPALARPVLVLREETERPEAVDAGVARLVGTDPEAIVGTVSALIHDRAMYSAMASGGSPYGDGRAAQRIVAELARRYGPEQVEEESR